MADNDFTTIKPVENLQNVANLTPTGRQQERKRRQNPPRQDAKAEATKTPEETDPKPQAGADQDAHVIDYCA